MDETLLNFYQIVRYHRRESELSPQITGRLRLMEPLLDLLHGRRHLLTKAEVDVAAVGRALNGLMGQKGDAVLLKVVDLVEAGDLSQNLDDYPLLFSDLALAEFAHLDGLYGNAHVEQVYGECADLLRLPMAAFFDNYAEIEIQLGTDLAIKMVTGLLTVVGDFIIAVIHDHLDSLRRLAPAIQLVAQVLPLGSFDPGGEDLTYWPILCR